MNDKAETRSLGAHQEPRWLSHEDRLSQFSARKRMVTDGRLVDVGITSMSARSYPAPALRKPLVLIVVLETADIDNELRNLRGLRNWRCDDIRMGGSI